VWLCVVVVAEHCISRPGEQVASMVDSSSWLMMDGWIDLDPSLSLPLLEVQEFRKFKVRLSRLTGTWRSKLFSVGLTAECNNQ